MFQSLANKVISGIISLSMMLLSSYEGNNARFAEMNTIFLDNSTVFKTQLLEAFENDFEDIIKSGSEINIFFTIVLKNGNSVFHENEFKHSVNFQPMEQVFYVTFEESNELLLYTSYEKVIEDLSKMEYVYKDRIPDQFRLFLTAHLEKIKLNNSSKEYDLMMLWNFKKPKIKTKITKPENET